MDRIMLVPQFQNETDTVLLDEPILAQYSISKPPRNVRKPKVILTFSGDIEEEHWAKIG